MNLKINLREETVKRDYTTLIVDCRDLIMSLNVFKRYAEGIHRRIMDGTMFVQAPMSDLDTNVIRLERIVGVVRDYTLYEESETNWWVELTVEVNRLYKYIMTHNDLNLSPLHCRPDFQRMPGTKETIITRFYLINDSRAEKEEKNNKEIITIKMDVQVGIVNKNMRMISSKVFKEALENSTTNDLLENHNLYLTAPRGGLSSGGNKELIKSMQVNPRDILGTITNYDFSNYTIDVNPFDKFYEYLRINNLNMDNVVASFIGVGVPTKHDNDVVEYTKLKICSFSLINYLDSAWSWTPTNLLYRKL